MPIVSVMSSSHLILRRPCLLLPPIPPSIRVFSNESTLCMRWPKYWSFSLSICPSNEHPGLISFRMDWLDLLAIRGTFKSALQHYSSKSSIFWCSAFMLCGCKCRLICAEVYCKVCVLWCTQCTVKTVSSDLEKCNHVGEQWMLQITPPWRPVPMGILWVLKTHSAGVGLPLWRLSSNFIKTDGGWDLTLENRGTPYAISGSSSPMRARTATCIPGET